MRKTLRHDTESGELRLVYTDLWRGQHERTEYRVMTRRERGHVVRNRPEFDGRPVHGTAPDLYLPAPLDGRAPVWTEPAPVVPTVKTDCPRASSPRRMCPLCAAEEA